jgi:hypothetical protein
MTNSELPDGAASRAHRASEVVHSLVYFVPEADEEFSRIGLEPGRMAYFASRAAPMGEVGPGVVVATFYNFNPALIARHIPRAWTLARPDEILAARVRTADTALRRLFGDDTIASAELAEAAELTRVAAEGCRPEGRPLYAAHADLDWPKEPHLVLWHAVTLLREHRGDGHIASLLRHGLTGLEALITHTATGRGFFVPAAKKLRGWSDEDWSGAAEGLRSRGLLDEDDELTELGAALRADLEQDTDVLARGPWAHLGAPGVERLIELGKPLSRQLLAAGAFPKGIFRQR